MAGIWPSTSDGVMLKLLPASIDILNVTFSCDLDEVCIASTLNPLVCVSNEKHL